MKFAKELIFIYCIFTSVQAYFQVSDQLKDCLKCLVNHEQEWCPLKNNFSKGMCLERVSTKSYTSSLEMGFCSTNVKEIQHAEKLRLTAFSCPYQSYCGSEEQSTIEAGEEPIKISKHLDSIHSKTGEKFSFTSQHFCRYLVKFPPNSKIDDSIKISGFNSDQINILVSVGESFEATNLQNYHYTQYVGSDGYITFKYPNQAYIITSLKLDDFGDQNGLYSFQVQKIKEFGKEGEIVTNLEKVGLEALDSLDFKVFLKSVYVYIVATVVVICCLICSCIYINRKNRLQHTALTDQNSKINDQDAPSLEFISPASPEDTITPKAVSLDPHFDHEIPVKNPKKQQLKHMIKGKSDEVSNAGSRSTNYDQQKTINADGNEEHLDRNVSELIQQAYDQYRVTEGKDTSNVNSPDKLIQAPWRQRLQEERLTNDYQYHDNNVIELEIKTQEPSVSAQDQRTPMIAGYNEQLTASMVNEVQKVWPTDVPKDGIQEKRDELKRMQTDLDEWDTK